MHRPTPTNAEIESRLAALRASLDHIPATEARVEVEVEIAELRALLRRPTHDHPETR